MGKANKQVIWMMSAIFYMMSWRAFAGCTNNSTSPNNILNSPASITINPYVATGMVLYSGTFSGNASQTTTTCSTAFTTVTYQGVGASTNGIYPTIIPGIGIRLSNASGAPGNWPTSEIIAPTTSFSLTTSDATNFQLIKTGPITTTGTLPVNVGNLVLPQQNNFAMTQINLASPMAINFNKPSCRVTSPVIAVSLGAVPTSHFPSVGSTSSLVPFNIQVTCVDGPGASTTQMYVTLTDASGSDVGNTSNTLALSPTSTAKGIGVQIQYNGTVESYGPDSSWECNINQFLLGTGSNGVYNFPFYANMVRTGKVAAGSVITTATFTMSYQ